MADSIDNNVGQVPQETYSRYVGKEKLAVSNAYSPYNNTYGMDLAYNYIPADLHPNVTVQNDYRLNTGLHCNNILSLGPEQTNVFRQLFTVLTVDQLTLDLTDSADDPTSFAASVPLNINNTYSFKPLPSSVGNDWKPLVPEPKPHTNPIDVLSKSEIPVTFTIYVPYNAEMRVNSLFSLYDFIDRKARDAYNISEQVQTLFGAGTYFGRFRGIFNYPPSRGPVDERFPLRDNTNILNGVEVPIDIANLYHVRYILRNEYLGNASWVMHPFTYKRICQLSGFSDYGRDVNGHELLLGKPVYFCDLLYPDAPVKILFGDLKEAFAYVDIVSSGRTPFRSYDLTEDEAARLVTSYDPTTERYYQGSKLIFRAFEKKTAFIFKNENAVIVWDELSPFATQTTASSFHDELAQTGKTESNTSSSVTVNDRSSRHRSGD